MTTKIFLLVSFLFCMSQVFSQDRTIKGKIVDETGQPMVGATVSLKGTSKAAVSDIDGNYSIIVPASGGVLVFSFVGYESKEVTIGTNDVVDVILTEEVQKLNEIIVVGYGVQKKSLVTGSIAKVDAKDLQNAVVTRFEQALQGKTSGVTIVQNSGAPGTSYTIKIRGNSSDGSNSPIYVVDGVKTDGMGYLNTNDIESIEVLKDGASAAIYGSEGGNGVIIITTKKGKAGQSQIQYNYSHGVQEATNLPKSMTGPQYRQYFMEAANYEKKPNSYKKFAALDSVTSTDWVSEVFRKAPMDEHNVNISGGAEKITYFASASYLNQDGVVGGAKGNYTRYTFRANIESEVKRWLNFGTNVSYSRMSQKNLNATNEYGGIINNAIIYDPTLPIYYTDTLQIKDRSKLRAWNNNNGRYYTKSDITSGEAWNPLAQIQYANDKQTQDKIVADMHVDFKPLKWFKFTSRISTDYAYQLHNIFNGLEIYGVSPITADTLTNLNQSWDRWYTYGIENFATIDKVFGEHTIQIMAGQSFRHYAHYWLSFTGYNIPYQSVDYAYPYNTNLNMKDNRVDDESHYPEGEKQASYFGRFVYSYKEKYMIQGNFRRDGSSKFGPNKKWADFPSVSAGWTISKEEFFQDFSSVSNLKLRGSWGKNGSTRILSSFPYVTTMSTVYYNDENGSLLMGKVPGTPSNLALKWETSEQTDIGLDLGMFRNSLTFTLDWYKKSTIDQLQDKSDQPLQLGLQGNAKVNGGEVVNKGWEFDLNFRKNIGALNYDITLNATYLKNEVTDYLKGGKDGANVGQLGIINRYEVGKPVWYFKGLKAIGIFQDTAEINHYGTTDPVTGSFRKLQPNAIPGDVKFLDLPVDSLGGVGNGVIDDNDATYLGKPMPTWTYGFNLGLEFKGIELSVFFQGVTGNQVYWAGYRKDRTEYNKPSVWYDDRWTGPGTSNTYPRATNNDVNQNFRVSSLNVFDGNYLRLKNLTVGYTFPAKWTRKIEIAKIRIYYTGTNLLTFTNYPGTDPEIGMYFDTSINDFNNNSFGIDKGVYPPTKINTIGVNVTF